VKAVEAQDESRQEPQKKDKEQSVTAPSKDLLGAEAQFLIPNFNLFHSINSPSSSGYNFSQQCIWCEDLLTVERAVSKAALEVEHTTARQRRNATSRSSEEARTLKKQWKQEPQLHLRIQYRKLYFRARRRFRKECLSLRLQALASEGVQSHSRKVFPSLTIGDAPTASRASWRQAAFHECSQRYQDCSNDEPSEQLRMDTLDSAVMADRLDGKTQPKLPFHTVLNSLACLKRGKAGADDHTVAEHWKSLST